jgi:hypothetical protein
VVAKRIVSMEEHGLALYGCAIRSEVELGQPVDVKIVLQNTSDTTVIITPQLHFGSWLDAEILSPGGYLLEPELLVNPLHTTAQAALAPGGTIEKVVDLRCPFGLGVVDPDDPNECLPMYRFNEVGTYRIQLRYSYLCDGGGCPPGEFEMNEVKSPPFEVLVRHRS